jgi:hypothetical protein
MKMRYILQNYVIFNWESFMKTKILNFDSDNFIFSLDIDSLNYKRIEFEKNN